MSEKMPNLEITNPDIRIDELPDKAPEAPNEDTVSINNPMAEVNEIIDKVSAEDAAKERELIMRQYFGKVLERDGLKYELIDVKPLEHKILIRQVTPGAGGGEVKEYRSQELADFKTTS